MYSAHVLVWTCSISVYVRRHLWGMVCVSGNFLALLQQGSHCLIQGHSLFVLVFFPLPRCQSIYSHQFWQHTEHGCSEFYMYENGLHLWEPVWERAHLGEWMSIYCRSATVWLSQSQRFLRAHTLFCSNVGGLLCFLCSLIVHEQLPHSSNSRSREILYVSNSWVRKTAQSRGNTNVPPSI